MIENDIQHIYRTHKFALFFNCKDSKWLALIENPFPGLLLRAYTQS